MTSERARLEAAYRATTYRIFLPSGCIELRPGQANPALEGWLVESGVGEWAILTACNPGSLALAARENGERQARLECLLLEEGFEPYAGENEADDGAWPAEETCFVPNISLVQALDLAGQFGQNAVLAGSVGGVPRLEWVDKNK